MTTDGSRRRARVALLLTAGMLVVAGSGLAGAGEASAADEVPADSSFAGTFYLANGNDGSDYPEGATLGWDDAVIALPAPGDLENRLVAPAGTELVVTFIAPQGSESDPTSWNATAPWELTPPGQWMPDVTPYHQISPGTGSPSGTNATATVSGDYSLGVAYLKDGGQHVVPGGLYFVHIHLTGSSDPEKATYTWQPVRAIGAPNSSSPSGGEPTGTTSTAGGLAFTAPVSGAAQLTVHGAQTATSAWTVTIATGNDARTLAAGASGDTQVDVPPAEATAVTITLVSG